MSPLNELCMYFYSMHKSNISATASFPNANLILSIADGLSEILEKSAALNTSELHESSLIAQDLE